MNGLQIILFARLYIGFKYILGAFVPKNEKNYKGAFDCAEFVAYCIFQVYGFLYGCETSDIKRANKADAYTGYFDRDAIKKGIEIPVDQAARTPGALLLRRPTGAAVGHIVISKGDGKTVEAHSTAKGLIESVVDGRRWSTGILLPGISYTENKPVVTSAPRIVYRLKNPKLMKDAFVMILQNALGIKEDGFYGTKTQAAVVAFQKKSGLIMDGEVMPGGETAKALGIHL